MGLLQGLEKLLRFILLMIFRHFVSTLLILVLRCWRVSHPKGIVPKGLLVGFLLGVFRLGVM